MTEILTEKRKFSRVTLDLPVDVQQGGSVWKQRLLDISLTGAATDQPDVWDAQYNEPFTLNIHVSDSETLELHAYLQHVENERLGFLIQHVDRSNLDPLVKLLSASVDIATLEQEIQHLD
jgi:hypothetical protein